MFLAATNRAMFERLCDALNKPQWTNDSKYKTRQSRKENSDSLENVLSGWFAKKTKKEAVDHLSKYSVPCASINDTSAAAREKYINDSQIMIEVPDAVAGTVWVTGKSIKFSRTPMEVEGAPLVGQHTDSILNSILQYDVEKIRKLKESGIIG